jgi:3-hydroxyisobutyrate dehydrogenase-like beta-hydroxyacid dehydrogenase
MATIGFLGTGNMGAAMARRLLGAGHELWVCDLRAEATRPLVESGAHAAASARELAARCRVVMSSLPGPAQIESAVRGADGLLAGARAGDVHVELSTSSWEMVRRIAALEAESGVHYLDAPVSGGPMGANQGTLTLMASGDAGAFAQVEPLLGAFAKSVFHLGESGAGTLVKLINNAIFLCAGLLAQEGFVLGAKAGLDPKRLLEVLKLSSGGMYSGLVETTLARDFERAFFSLALAEKDVALALDSARALEVPMPVTSAAHQTYLGALAQGLGAQVFFATLQALERGAGTRVGKLGG